MSRLMQEHIDSLKEQAFVAPKQEQIEKDRKRLERIREVSADYIAEMGRLRTKNWRENMTEKPSVTLPGKVDKVIKPFAEEPEKAQISIHDGDPLYREIRIENSLQDTSGNEVRLKEDEEVDVTVEADGDSARPKKKGVDQVSSPIKKQQKA
jgi:hypothetical protein